jgi:hypothetical protein
MCTKVCACQDLKLQRLSKIDRHKARGWVGVTGGFVSNGRTPSSRIESIMRPEDVEKLRAHGNADAVQPLAPTAASACPDARGVKLEGAEIKDTELSTNVPAEAVAPPCANAEASSCTRAPRVPRATSAEPERQLRITALLPTRKRTRRPTEAKVGCAEASKSPPSSRSKRLCCTSSRAAVPDFSKPKSLVGWRVEAFFDLYQCHFAGVINECRRRGGQHEHRIAYDDGDYEWSVRFRLCAPHGSVNLAAGAAIGCRCSVPDDSIRFLEPPKEAA